MADAKTFVVNAPAWIDLSTKDPAAARDYYSKLFGWQAEPEKDPEAGGYAIARLDGKDVAGIGGQQDPNAPSAWMVYIGTSNADATAKKIEAEGGKVVAPPFDVMDAGRMAVLSDHEGAVFCVWQANRHRGAGIVNEPGSLNFNGLNARDPEAAKAFYGLVFGWQTLDLGGGAQFWTLPGYGDYLAQGDPELRERLAESGGPAGFEDVVAALTPLAADQPDVPPNWSVTFAVDDADATAARASELGGRVVVAPFDAPWVRMTVLADPQGATFIASKFVPENKDLGSEAGSTVSAA